MKKIIWITSDCFFDVDLSIIKTFNNCQQFDIEWNLIYSKNRVTTYNKNDLETEIGKGLIKFRHLFLNHRLRSINTLFKFLTLILCIRKSKVDIVYINCELEPYFLLIIKLLLGSKHIIYAIHDVEPHSGIPKIFHFFLYLKIKMFNNFHVFSINQKNIFFLKYKLIQKNVYYAPLFLKHFGESKLLPPKDKIYFLFFGTIRENKGLEYLIEATNKLSDKYKGRFIVQIAGECKEWIIYESMIKDFSIFELTIEVIPNDKIANLFCQSHYLVLPYKDVTQCGPLLIAFNYGVPAIASKLPGFVENIKDKETGFLFQTENSDSLYNVMSTIIENHDIIYQNLKYNLNTYINDTYHYENIKHMYIDMFDKINSNA